MSAAPNRPSREDLSAAVGILLIGVSLAGIYLPLGGIWFGAVLLGIPILLTISRARGRDDR